MDTQPSKPGNTRPDTSHTLPANNLFQRKNEIRRNALAKLRSLLLVAAGKPCAFRQGDTGAEKSGSKVYACNRRG